MATAEDILAAISQLDGKMNSILTNQAMASASYQNIQKNQVSISQLIEAGFNTSIGAFQQLALAGANKSSVTLPKRKRGKSKK